MLMSRAPDWLSPVLTSLSGPVASQSFAFVMRTSIWLACRRSGLDKILSVLVMKAGKKACARLSTSGGLKLLKSGFDEGLASSDSTI